MRIKKIYNAFGKYILRRQPEIVFISLTIIFIICSFLSSGLLFEAVHHIIVSMRNDTGWISDGCRTVTRFIEIAPAYISIRFLGVKNLHALIIAQGFWVYFVPLALLFAAYLKLRSQKNTFQLILASYLLCLNFAGGAVYHESFLLAGAYWAVFSIFFVDNFNTISYKSLALLLGCCFLMVYAYDYRIAFCLILLIWFVLKMRNFKFSRNALRAGLLFLAPVFFVWSAALLWKRDMLFSGAGDVFILYLKMIVLASACVILGIIYCCIKSKFKTKFITPAAGVIIFLLLLHYNFLYSWTKLRAMNLIIPLLISLVLLGLRLKKISFDFKSLKLINFVLLFAFIINFFNIAQHVSLYFKTAGSYLHSSGRLCFYGNFQEDVLPADKNLSFRGMRPFLSYHIAWASLIIQKKSAPLEINNLIFWDNPDGRYFEIFGIDIKNDILPDLSPLGITYSPDFRRKIHNYSLKHNA